MLKITLHSRLFWGSLLLCAATVGCASGKSAKRSAKPDPEPLKDQKPALAGGALRQTIGKVILVNERMGFVLVDIGTAPAPAAGTPLQSYLQSEPTANMSVSVYQRRPYLIADVVGGAPRVGDSVALMASRGGASANTPKTGQDSEAFAAPPERETAFRPRTEVSGGVIAPVRIFDRNRVESRLADEVSAGVGVGTEETGSKAGEKIGLSVPSEPSAANQSDSAPAGSAIPGLPLRRGRAVGP